MRIDGSDVSSLGVIAFGALLGLLGTGAMLERLDEARSPQTIDVRSADPTTVELLRARAGLRLQPGFRTKVDLRNGPVIFIDGVRVGVAGSLGEVLDDLDRNEVESVAVRAGPRGRTDPEIRIRLRQ